MTQIDLRGRKALVTGASRGIGRSIALALAEGGAAVTVHYNGAEKAADEVVASIEQSGGQAVALAADVRDRDMVASMVSASAERWGGLDILVCNAGIWKRAPIGSMSEADWDETIDINLKGMYLVTHFATPYLKESSSGAVINIASTAGQRGEAEYGHYAASKGGMIAWTKSLAPELAPWGVRVNCVAPGWVRTDMAAQALADAGETITSIIPLGRAGEPGEIASVACFLASDLASYMTGEVVNVNGGNVLCG